MSDNARKSGDVVVAGQDDLFRHRTQPLRFVIFVSYGNDSIALIQWAHEARLDGVAVVFTDTGWAADGWMERVEASERWVKSLGFTPHRTHSVGFRQLARDKKGFPTQQFQWCSYVLKIEPGKRWLELHDPDCRAVCLLGVRREESQDRADFPAYLLNSGNHGGRVMVAPFADYTTEQRDALIARAGYTVLPHRSRECKCINSKRADMRRFTDTDWAEIKSAEEEIGKTMFRPHRHMGASGADEVRRWANSDYGKFIPAARDPRAVELEDAPTEANLLATLGDCRASDGACES